MKPPAFEKRFRKHRSDERGVTMLLVALAMVAIIAMAALSIDVITLYLAREEAQRTADAAALAAARIISLSGITSDPNNTDSTWQPICGTNGAAAQAAKAVAAQSAVGGAGSTVLVSYSSHGTTVTDCANITPVIGSAFGINPIVTVQISRSALPTFFSRIWGNAGNTVSASATAEVFNPSGSGTRGNRGVTGTIIPVQPRCVKPIFVPNLDPRLPSTSCTSSTSTPACQALVSTTDGHVMDDGKWPTGIAGEEFWLIPDCAHHARGSCTVRHTTVNPPVWANYPTNGGSIPVIAAINLLYLPGQSSNTSIAVPSGASSDLYEQAVAGCDQTTVYYCGVPRSSPIGSGPNMVDLSIYPADDTSSGIATLINETNVNSGSQPTGQDYFNPPDHPTYPLFSTSLPGQILAGTSNPLVTAGLTTGTPLTSSNSIISLPIFDQTQPLANTTPGTQSAVTVVGFLQVFINSVDQYGNLDVTVLNAAGCSNGGGNNVSSNAITGTSPVPVRLITPP